MVEENLRQKTISAMIWSTFGKFGTLGISFVSNIVLARLLMPEDFGCIGMLQIFIAISDILIIGGFGAALVQKKSPIILSIPISNTICSRLSSNNLNIPIPLYCGNTEAKQK